MVSLAALALVLAFCFCASGCRSKVAQALDVQGRQGDDKAVGSAEVPGDHAGSGADPVAAATVQPPATEICVYVSGAAVNRGVYRLAAGARACDALWAAGGATKDACLDLVNLAAPVIDGQQLHIPSRAEVAAQAYTTAGSGLVTKAAGPLNLNRATATQLTGLPGVGPVLAARIVAYRTAHGPFAKVDDLLEVQGIGASKLADLRSLVAVAP